MWLENYADTLYGRVRHSALQWTDNWNLGWEITGMVTVSATEEQSAKERSSGGKPTFLT
jgi:hypothetical protein